MTLPPSSRFDAATYPGWRPEGPSVVVHGRVAALQDAEVSSLAGSRLAWSVAHGSNACPDRLIDKGLDAPGAILLPARMVGWRPVFEARRTRSTGAIPLTLVADAGYVHDCWLLGVSREMLGVLDASEGRGMNYELGVVGDVAVADRFVVRGALGWGPSRTTEVLGGPNGGDLTWPEHDQADASAALGIVDAATADGRTPEVRAVPPLPAVGRRGWPTTTLEHLPIFVYGSLQPDAAAWPLLAAHVVGETPATVAGVLHDSGNGWPTAAFRGSDGDPVDGDGVVHGRLLRWDHDRPDEVLQALDAYEGHPGFFRRRAVQVSTESGEDTWALAYEWNLDEQGPLPGHRLPSGRWTG